MKRGIQVIILVALSMLLLNPLQVSGQFSFMGNEAVGKKVQDFTLPMLNGEESSLNEFRDRKKAIVFFWATWCPHCRVALKELNDDREAIESKGIKIVLVDVGENAETVDKYFKKNGIGMDAFLDVESEVSTAYGLVGVPTFYFVDKRGIVRKVGHSLPQDLDKVFLKS